MAIVAFGVALLLLFLGGRHGDPTIRRILYVVAGVAAAFALYLVVFDPALAWDLRWVGRLVTRMAGHGMRELLR